MKIRNLVVFIMLSIFVAAASGCGHHETYGERISNRNITALGNILAHPKDYDGKTVTIKGKITLECNTGCWFNLKDGDAVIYVDLSPSGFAIPQNSGRGAIVEGTVMTKDGKLTLVSKGVELQ